MIEAILGFGKSVVGLAKDSPFKLAMILALVGLVTGFVTWGYYEIKTSGYNECKIDVAAAEDAAEAEKVKQLKAQIEAYKQKEADRRKALAEAEEKIAELEKLHREIDLEIREFEPVETCTNIGADFLRLYIKPIEDKPSI